VWTRDPSSILRHPQHPSGFRLLLEKAEDPDELKIYVETLAFKPPGDVIILLRVTGGWIYHRNIMGISRCGAPQFIPSSIYIYIYYIYICWFINPMSIHVHPCSGSIYRRGQRLAVFLFKLMDKLRLIFNSGISYGLYSVCVFFS